MTRRYLLLLFAAFALLAAGCSLEREQTPVAPASTAGDAGGIDAEAFAWTLVGEAGWPVEEGLAADRAMPHCPLFQFARQRVVDDIFHYSLRIPVGPGEHDLIGIHRVVRERRPFVPIRTPKACFLQHGDIKDFVGMFLPGVSSPRMPDDFGIAVTLAEADIDVWGIDQGWTLVPAEVADFGFMRDWGLDRAVRDLGVALDVARLTRWITGNGLRAMPLLGYSSGSGTAIALLNAETQMPPAQRRVNAFIAGDFGLVSNDPDLLTDWGAEYAALLEAYNNGYYKWDSPFPIFGFPALQDPGEPSELIEGLTNLQAAIGIGAWPSYPHMTYHFLGGVFGGEGIPIGLQYTDVDMWIDFMVSGPPYEAMRFMVEYESCSIIPEDVPWEDHLGEITMPVFYLTAVGSAGDYTELFLDMIGSTDVTRLDISFHPPEEILLEFAHVDLFIANDAPTLVFAPIRDWVLSHTPD